MKLNHKNNRLKTIAFNMSDGARMKYLKKQHRILKIPFPFQFWYELLNEVKEIERMTGIPKELKEYFDEILEDSAIRERERLSF